MPDQTDPELPRRELRSPELRSPELRSPELPAPFVIAAVEGVTLTKWTRAWQEQRPEIPLEVVRTTSVDQLDPLESGHAQVAFLRDHPADARLSAIPLYSEQAVVVAQKEHPVALFDTVVEADLADEVHHHGSFEDSIALVAAGGGVVVVPQSIARLHARSDTVVRPVTDAPQTGISLAWVTEHTSERIEYFIGIVRGRTARSSRSSPSGGTPDATDRVTERSGRPSKSPPKPGSKKRPTEAEARAAALRRKRSRGRG